MSATEMTVETLLRAHAPHAPETLRTRVLALEPAPRRVDLPSRRLALVLVVAAALGVALAAALVHGLLGSSSQPTVQASPTVGRLNLHGARAAGGGGSAVKSVPAFQAATASAPE